LNADLLALADAEVKADHHMSTLVRFNRAWPQASAIPRR
jgi:hypothetical protein